MSDSLIIQYIDLDTLPALLELQKQAYQSEAVLYQDPAIQPLTQTLDDLYAEQAQGMRFLGGYFQGRLVAAVRGYIEAGTAFLGKLMVHPDYQQRGYGRFMMGAIEDEFATAQRFELFTGHKSERNIRFYENAAYRIFKIRKINERLSMVYFEKLSTTPNPSYLMGKFAGYEHIR